VESSAARIFRLVETIVNGIADIIAGSIGGLANAVESALGQLIAPVIDFLADYLGFGDLPDKVKDTRNC
jgi:phage-related protein